MQGGPPTQQMGQMNMGGPPVRSLLRCTLFRGAFSDFSTLQGMGGPPGGMGGPPPGGMGGPPPGGMGGPPPGGMGGYGCVMPYLPLDMSKRF